MKLTRLCIGMNDHVLPCREDARFLYKRTSAAAKQVHINTVHLALS